MPETVLVLGSKMTGAKHSVKKNCGLYLCLPIYCQPSCHIVYLFF